MVPPRGSALGLWVCPTGVGDLPRGSAKLELCGICFPSPREDMPEERISPSGLYKMPSLCPSPFENSFLTGWSWSGLHPAILPSLPFQMCPVPAVVPLELHHLFSISSGFSVPFFQNPAEAPGLQNCCFENQCPVSSFPTGGLSLVPVVWICSAYHSHSKCSSGVSLPCRDTGGGGGTHHPASD